MDAIRRWRMSDRYAKHCRYCRGDFAKIQSGPTIDHVIPKWVMRLFTHRPFANPRKGFHLRNQVTACHGCNRRKGSMPVVVFLAVRLEKPAVVKAERRKWDGISRQLNEAGRAGALAHPLAEMVIAEFLKPIPPHFVTGTRSIEVKYADQPAVDFVRGQ